MGKPYSDDLRDRVVTAMASGRSCREVREAFDLAPSTAGNWYRRYQATRSYAARPTGGDRRSKLTDEAGWIAERLDEARGLTLVEVREELEERDINVSYTSVWRIVRRLGLRHKKITIFATEQDRLDVAIAREIWRVAQRGLDFASLVFVDETGTATNMTRT